MTGIQSGASRSRLGGVGPPAHVQLVRSWSAEAFPINGALPGIQAEHGVRELRSVLQDLQLVSASSSLGSVVKVGALADAVRQGAGALSGSENDFWRLCVGPSMPAAPWLADALKALAEIDDEIAEDDLPAVSPDAKAEAERIIRVLAGCRYAVDPTVYPTWNAEIAINFKPADRPESVVIRLNGSGQADCYTYVGGSSRRAHYATSSDVPDAFVHDRLRALAPVG